MHSNKLSTWWFMCIRVCVCIYLHICVYVCVYLHMCMHVMTEVVSSSLGWGIWYLTPVVLPYKLATRVRACITAKQGHTHLLIKRFYFQHTTSPLLSFEETHVKFAPPDRRMSTTDPVLRGGIEEIATPAGPDSQLIRVQHGYTHILVLTCTNLFAI